jgi:hypothetical protein
MLESAPSPVQPASATRPWYRHPAFIAVCALSLVAIIVIPTAVVLTQGPSSSSSTTGTAPTSILDLKMVCVMQNRTQLDISYREAGFTVEMLSDIVTNSTGAVAAYPKELVKPIGTVRLLSYPPPDVGPFAGPACIEKPHVPCMLMADPADLLANRELAKSATTSSALAPALSTLWADSEHIMTNGIIYTVTVGVV